MLQASPPQSKVWARRRRRTGGVIEMLVLSQTATTSRLGMTGVGGVAWNVF